MLLVSTRTGVVSFLGATHAVVEDAQGLVVAGATEDTFNRPSAVAIGPDGSIYEETGSLDFSDYTVNPTTGSVAFRGKSKEVRRAARFCWARETGGCLLPAPWCGQGRSPPFTPAAMRTAAFP